MTLLPRLCRLVVLACLLSGCVTTTGKAPGGVTPNAVAGDAIEVTALDAPAVAPAAVPAAAGLPEAPTQGAAPPAEPEVAAPVPAPVPTEAALPADAATTDPVTDAPAEAVPVVTPKSDREIACERKRGIWADAGGGLMVCVKKTKDSGKRCTKESDCEGVCLARSGTCAPADPMLGCNEVLQDDGSQATLCIE